jgi:hypothetical protein
LKYERKLDNKSFLCAEVLFSNVKITTSCLQIVVKVFQKEKALPKEIDKVATASYQSLKHIEVSTETILYHIRSDLKVKKVFKEELFSSVVSLHSVS